MDPIFLLLFFVTFLFIGSFLGVLIDRIYRGEQFVSGSSYCESCKHKLTALDLIPVFSYLFLNGKCRYCRKPIPNSLPIMEITTAVTLTSVLSYVSQLDLPFLSPVFIFAAIIALLISAIFILIFFTDAKYMAIPDIYMYLLAGLFPFYFWIFKSSSAFEESIPVLKDSLLAGLVLALFFAALHYGSRKKAMGEGDIYLSGLIGLYLGTQLSLVMSFTAFLTGALYGIVLMTMGRKKMKSAIPFGPFLIIGMVVALVCGQNIVNWYWSI